MTLVVLGLVATALALWWMPGPSESRLRRLDPAPPSRRLHDLARESFLAARLRHRQDERAWREASVELCDALAAELIAGRPPEDALGRAAALLPRAPATAISAARASPDIPTALERLADRPGAQNLRLLAACWRIGVDRGGTLAAIVDALAEALRDEEAHRRHITAQLAAPKATAHLLAALPLLGLAMAWALGTDPLAYFFTTLPGLTCLLLGISLDLTGLYWTRRISARAENPP